jgi:hypothetical protein
MKVSLMAGRSTRARTATPGSHCRFVRILPDENMPESLRHALVELGHEVDSVSSLRLEGIDNRRRRRAYAKLMHPLPHSLYWE